MRTTWARYGNGYSRSINAETAEEDGRLPLTRAIPIVARAAGVTRAAARAALLATHDGEWHHVGRYAARVPYYSTEAAIERLDPNRRAKREMAEFCEQFMSRWRELCALPHVAPVTQGYTIEAFDFNRADRSERGWHRVTGYRIRGRRVYVGLAHPVRLLPAPATN
jgi:hypothetical protein